MDKLKRFVEICMIHKKAHVEQDESLLESSTDELMEIRKRLFEEGLIPDLSKLFAHEEDWVKYHAAFWLLPTNKTHLFFRIT